MYICSPEKEIATHFSIAWKIPCTEEAWKATVQGVTKRGTQQGTQTCAHAHVCWVDKVPLELEVTHIIPDNYPWMKTSYINKLQATQNSVCLLGLTASFLFTNMVNRNWNSFLFSLLILTEKAARTSNKRQKADYTSQSTESPWDCETSSIWNAYLNYVVVQGDLVLPRITH